MGKTKKEERAVLAGGVWSPVKGRKNKPTRSQQEIPWHDSDIVYSGSGQDGLYWNVERQRDWQPVQLASMSGALGWETGGGKIRAGRWV